jgi:hypothetical protein
MTFVPHALEQADRPFGQALETAQNAVLHARTPVGAALLRIRTSCSAV